MVARYAAQGRARPFRAVYVDGSLESTDVAAIAEIAAQLEVREGWGWGVGGWIEGLVRGLLVCGIVGAR